MRALIMLLMVAGGIHAGEARGAYVHHRISSRDVALNQPVEVRFTTLKPQVEGVDPQQVITDALTLPRVQRHWRLIGRVKTEVDKKINTLSVRYRLLPRHSGVVSLPVIPIRWLRDNTVSQMGEVRVREGVTLGSELLRPPREMDGVAGIPWGTAYSQIKKEYDAEGEYEEITDSIVVPAKPGLDLLVRGGILAATRIEAPRLSLEQARASFVERWGDPIDVTGESGDEIVTWIVGWIRIQARAHDGGTVIYFIHEEMEARLAKRQVEKQVFDLLDPDADGPFEAPPARGDQGAGEDSAARGSDADEEGEAPADTGGETRAEGGEEGFTDEELERAFERAGDEGRP